MVKRSVPRSPRPEHVRRTSPLGALLALAVATGAAATLLAVRALVLVDDLTPTRFETYLELLVVGAGALLAAWVFLTSSLAATCILLHGVGRRWRAGEQLVLRHAPGVVRRLAGTGIALSVGTGLVLGAGSAQAAVAPPIPAPAPTTSAVLDLGWQPTTPITGSAGHTDATAQDADLPTAPGAGHSAPAPPTDPEVTSPQGPATSRDSPTSTPSTAATASPQASPSAPAQAPPAGSPAAAGTPDPAGPGLDPLRTPTTHVPLGDLLGGAQRSLPPTAGAGESASTTPAADTGASTVSVVVVRGDSLWSLARQALGDGATDAQTTAEWQRWFAANAQVIGDDPDLIKPGQVLQVPATL